MESNGPRRYVVQQHELSAFRHWDLMLERADGLATWQLSVPPEVVAAVGRRVWGLGIGDWAAGEQVPPTERDTQTNTIPAPPVPAGIPAKRLPDHRKAYLDYEGPVSGNRGEVHIVDSGTYTLLAAGEAEWLIELAGRVLRGRFRLVRQGDTDDWRLIPSPGGAAEGARCGT